MAAVAFPCHPVRLPYTSSSSSSSFQSSSSSFSSPSLPAPSSITTTSFGTFDLGTSSVHVHPNAMVASSSSALSSGGGGIASSAMTLSVSETSQFLPMYNATKTQGKPNSFWRFFFNWKYVGGDIEEGDVQRYALAFLSVTIRTPITPWILLALFFSYVPFIIFVAFFLWCMALEAFLPFYGICIVTCGGIFCEAFLKNLVKESRPAASAVTSYGMPSSHCMTSYSLMIWITIESQFPQIANAYLSLRMAALLLAIGLLAPVPWARCYLEDHTSKQCLLGCVAGILWGIIAFIIRYFLVFPGGFVF